MVSSEINKLANAVGAKSARACDNCIKRRARWYCAADDAFLCQSCDSTVHSANPLARRHERVRLKTSSVVRSLDEDVGQSRKPTWHQGFTRKARTPRRHRKQNSNGNPIVGHLVPEILSEENSHDDENEEEQLLYRVPIFDPFELCASVNSNEVLNSNNNNNNIFMNDADDDSKQCFGPKPNSHFNYQEINHFLPTEMDLAEFAADVESLLGNGLENEAFDMEGLGLLDNCDDEEREKESRVKVEDDEEVGEVIINSKSDNRQVAEQGDFIDVGREAFVLNFDYDSPVMVEEEEEEDNKGQNNIVEPVIMVNNKFEGCNGNNNNNEVYDSKKIFLRLDYEGVMSAWDDEKSPWTNGERPDLDAGECWPDCVGACGAMHVYGEMGPMNTHASVMSDGGREARVSRYREKRRTRLFSKKIRYEVRKLNAEKRPRMKGRFVKRANFVAPASLALIK